MIETENTYCAVCFINWEIEEIEFDLENNPRCPSCGEYLDLPIFSNVELNMFD